MRTIPRKVYVALAVIMLLGLAAFGSQMGTPDPPTQAAPAAQPLPPSHYFLNGQPADYHPQNQASLGYNDRVSGSQPVETLDALLPGPRQMLAPLEVKYPDDLGSVERKQTVSQRAIVRTLKSITKGQSVNVLPSKQLAMHKPRGATPDDHGIDENNTRLSSTTFAVAYIEANGPDKTVVLVTAEPRREEQRSSSGPDGTFYLDRGITHYTYPVENIEPDEVRVTHIVWRAFLMQPDCGNERKLRNHYSSSCILIREGDNQAYAGYDNVILVTPVHVLESHHFFESDDPSNLVGSSSSLNLLVPVSRDGLRTMPGLQNDNYPSMSGSKYEAPISSVFEDLQSKGTLFGGNDIASLPTFSVLDK